MGLRLPSPGGPKIVSVNGFSRFVTVFLLFYFASGQKGPNPPTHLPEAKSVLFFGFEKQYSSPGVLPQAPFFSEKMRFWSWNVAAGAFF